MQTPLTSVSGVSCYRIVMHPIIAPLSAADQAAIWEMVYQALYVPPDDPPFPREILREPQIARYAEGYGRAGDFGFKAIDEDSRILGAAWVRIWSGDDRGYGFIDAPTPELSIAVLPRYRGMGIGTALMSHLIEAVSQCAAAISLSVSASNPAMRLYQRCGFVEHSREGDSVTMIRRFA